MSYDNTSYYGDLLVDEYDDKCNFIGTNTPMGYLAYHLLGDGFDLMSELCSKFMNDFSILTADTRSLDTFWGVSYNLPRPLLYEGSHKEYLFEDLPGDLTKYSGADSRVTASSTNGVITLTWVSGTYQFWANPSGSEFDYSGDFTVEFDILSNGNNATIQIYDDSASTYYTKTLNQLNGMNAGHFKIVKDGQVFRTFVDGVEKTSQQVNSDITGACRVGFRQGSASTIQFRNFQVYRGDDKERKFTDEEYRAYLYLRNCRLITREDIEIAMNNVFGFDDYPIVFSYETFYLEATDHLNYEPTDTVSSNLHKNSEDSTLHFVTDYSNDETTETIESGLSIGEELVTVVNIPFNAWDKEFLEFMEQYISIKGNIKIKEYSL